MDERHVVEVLEDLEDLMTYWVEETGRAYPPDASGHTFHELYAAGLLPARLVELLDGVVERVSSGKKLSDDPMLFQAWLFAFELHASSRSLDSADLLIKARLGHD